MNNLHLRRYVLKTLRLLQLAGRRLQGSRCGDRFKLSKAHAFSGGPRTRLVAVIVKGFIAHRVSQPTGYRSKDGDRPRHRDVDGDREDKDSSYQSRYADDGARDHSIKREDREHRRSRSPERTRQSDPPRGNEGFRHAPPGGPRNNMPPDGPRHAGTGPGGRPGHQNGQGYRQGPGYQHGPGYQSRGFEQNRPLDRRAIEEGRRQRELERAMRAQKEQEREDRKPDTPH